MAKDGKPPARHSPTLPSVLRDVTVSDHLQSGSDFSFGPRGWILERRKRVVDRSRDLMLSQASQSSAYEGLLDARIRVAKKFSEVADLANLLAEEQREREHRRTVSENRRVVEDLEAAHNIRLTIAQQDLEIARMHEQVVRAQRNLEASRRVADVQVDAWYAQASAQRNEAEAVKQDTAVDLQRTHSVTSPDVVKSAMAEELAKAIATIDNEIELATGRGNTTAVLALQNVRARLKSVP
jgi:hypothetical protein